MLGDNKHRRCKITRHLRAMGSAGWEGCHFKWNDQGGLHQGGDMWVGLNKVKEWALWILRGRDLQVEGSNSANVCVSVTIWQFLPSSWQGYLWVLYPPTLWPKTQRHTFSSASRWSPRVEAHWIQGGHMPTLNQSLCVREWSALIG